MSLNSAHVEVLLPLREKGILTLAENLGKQNSVCIWTPCGPMM